MAQDRPSTDRDVRGPLDFATLDADGSGEITEEDLGARRAAMFAELDTDGDGSISEAEFVAHAQAMASDRARDRFSGLDADGDGRLGPDVLARGRGGDRMGARMIERLDTDGSGGLSEEEFAEARQRGPHRHGDRSSGRRGVGAHR